jgi:hypothetical protein
MLAAVAVVVAAAVSACAPGPPQPPSGLGANGPCTQTSRAVPNPTAPNQSITVYEPGGSAATPLVGGACGDAKRPVVAMVHGYLAGSTLFYADEINHLVSIGNVVIFATYETDTNNFAASFQREDQALVAAVAATPRADVTRYGIVGHSMGGGAVPYLAQQADGRGWGSNGMFLFLLAPWFTAGVGTGPITLPAQARVVVEGYDNDTWVDNRIGVEMFEAFTTPDARKQHVTIRSQTHGGATLNAQHTAPNSIIAPNDAIKFYGLYRIGDALQSCTLTGQNCNTDLTVMGTWPDGTTVTPAISTDNPVDTGPVANSLAIFGLDGECTAPANPRAATCGPTTP